MSTSVISPSSPPSDAHQIPLPLSSSSNSNTSAQSLSKEHIASQTAEFLFGSSTTPQPASTPLPPLPSSPSSASASSSDSGDSDFVTGSIITTKEENTINYSSPSQDISDQQTSSYPVNMEYSRSSDGSKPARFVCKMSEDTPRIIDTHSTSGWNAAPSYGDSKPPPKAWVEPSRSYSGDRLNPDWGRQPGSYSNGNSSGSSGTPNDRSPGLPHPSSGSLGDDGWPKPKEHLKGWSESSPAGNFMSPSSSHQGQTASNSATPHGWGSAPGPSAPVPVPTHAHTSVPSYGAPQSSNYQQYQQPTQSYTAQTNHNQFDQRGRPLSPDGWPAKKTAVRGFTEPVPDILTDEEVKKMKSKTLPAQTSGWNVTGGSGSSSIGGTRRTPTQSSMNQSQAHPQPAAASASEAGFRYPAQGPAASVSSENANNNDGWRTSTPKPAPKASPGAPASHLSAPAGPSSAHVPQQQQPRSISGWTLGGATTDGNFTSTSSVPPVPSIPQQYASSSRDQQPPPLVKATSPVPVQSQRTSVNGVAPNEAWILGDVDAVKSNNWTPTTRRSRVSREEVSATAPTYINGHFPGPSYISQASENNFRQQQQQQPNSVNGSRAGWSASANESFAPDENSIRPSESASNVGMESTASGWNGNGDRIDEARQPTTGFTPLKPRRQFQGEKDSDTGSNGSSGSYQDNPNAIAGGWQRTPPRNVMSPNGPPQQAAWNGNSQQNGAGWNQPSFQQAPMAAPTPKRWESTSQQFVGDLERAATPRGSTVYAPPMRHNRSGSTVGANTGTATMSIRGAHKYHAESIQLKDELAKIKVQVQEYEKALSSISDAGERGGNGEDSVSQQLDELRSENESLRQRLDAVEHEKVQLKQALLPILQLLGIKVSISGNASSSYTAGTQAPNGSHQAIQSNSQKPVGW